MVEPDLGKDAIAATMWTLGIDIGGTEVKLAVVDDRAKICYESSNPTLADRGLASFLAELRSHIDDVLAAARKRGAAVSAIGIGVPGLVHDNRIVGGINNLPVLRGVSLADELAAIDLPIAVENDGFLMGVAESRFGVATNSANVVFLTVGTGIGAALKLNGRFYRGASSRACEIGHMVLSYGGAPCSCGNRGCFEVMASTSALVRRYTSLAEIGESTPQAPLTGPDLVRRYRDAEPAAIEAFNWHFDHLAAGVASLINIFDPQQVVIGGGITESGAFYLAELRKRVSEGIMEASIRNTSIDLAGLGNRAGFIGAACLFSGAGTQPDESPDALRA